MLVWAIAIATENDGCAPCLSGRHRHRLAGDGAIANANGFCFGYGCGFGATCGFDTFGGCSAGGFFGFTQSPAHGGVRVFSLMSTGGVGRVTRGRVSGSGGSFGLGLSEERLFADLLSGAMSQLRAILAA